MAARLMSMQMADLLGAATQSQTMIIDAFGELKEALLDPKYDISC